MAPFPADYDIRKVEQMRKIGMNTLSFRGSTFADCARLIKQYELDATFSDVMKSDAEQASLAEVIDQNGLSYESLHAPFDHINDIWFDTEGGRQMAAELKTSVDRCAIANVPILVVHLSSGLTPPPPTDIGRGRFIDLVSYAASRNVSIAFENQRMLGNIAWAFEEFKNAQNVGFCWDCGHEYCFTPGRHYMPLFGHKLICTHLHDNTSEFNLDRHLIPFDGNIPFDFVAKQIKDSGYQGTLMLEIFPRFQPGVYNSYQDYSLEQFVSRAAVAVKKLRDMIDGK